MEKTCPEHGYFRDKVTSDAKLWLLCEGRSFEDERGVEEHQARESVACPTDCGLCAQHMSTTCLGQVDLSNRCNLTCPVCFASANQAGYLSEPSFEEVVGLLRALRDQKPVPAAAVQFTGGEPTLHPEFFRILDRRARDGLHPRAVRDQRGHPGRAGLRGEGGGGGAADGVPAVRRDGRLDLPQAARGAADGDEARGGRGLPAGRDPGRPRADAGQGRERRPGGAHPPLRGRERGRDQRDRVPAGGVHGPDRPPRARGEALHARATWRPRSRRRRGPTSTRTSSRPAS